MAKTLVEARDWLVKNAPKRGGCCSYFLECDDGIHEHVQDICHARANPSTAIYYGQGRAKRIDEVHTCTPISTEDKSYSNRDVITTEEGTRYYSYIFDRDSSPYKQLFKNAEFHKNNDGTYIGVSILDTDVPTALVMNFLIATRMPWEKPHVARTFCEAVDIGLHPAEAFMLGTTTTRDKHWLTLAMGGGHDVMYGKEWQNPGKPNVHNILNIKNGTPDFNNCGMNAAKSYKEMNTGLHWHKMWQGSNLLNPFKCRYDKVEIMYYTGKFGRLAKTIPDFPLPFQITGDGDAKLTLKQLKETRNQWSLLP